jgi:hypothetical protein
MEGMEAPSQPPPPGGLVRHLTPQTAALAAELRGLLLPAFTAAPGELPGGAAQAAPSAPADAGTALAGSVGSLPAAPPPPPDPATGLKDILAKVCVFCVRARTGKRWGRAGGTRRNKGCAPVLDGSGARQACCRWAGPCTDA